MSFYNDLAIGAGNPDQSLVEAGKVIDRHIIPVARAATSGELISACQVTDWSIRPHYLI